MEQEMQIVTNHLIQQACATFRTRCSSHPPPLRDLFEVVVQIAREISETLTAEQVLSLLQEHPEWVQQEARLPGRTSIASMVAEHLATLIRHYINTHWTALLLNQP